MSERINRKESSVLKPAVIGSSDGLIIILAICTAFYVSAINNQDIILPGLLAAIIGTIIITIGGYFAEKSRQESFAEISEAEEDENKKAEVEKTIQLFKRLDLGKDMQDQAAIEIEKDSNEWKSFLKEQLQEPEKKNAKQLPRTAFIIGVSFALGSIIPIVPYLFFKDKTEAFRLSCIISMLALLLVGYIKSKLNKEPVLWGTIRIIMLGALSAIAAYAIATILVN